MVWRSSCRICCAQRPASTGSHLFGTSVNELIGSTIMGGTEQAALTVCAQSRKHATGTPGSDRNEQHLRGAHMQERVTSVHTCVFRAGLGLHRSRCRLSQASRSNSSSSSSWLNALQAEELGILRAIVASPSSSSTILSTCAYDVSVSSAKAQSEPRRTQQRAET